MALPVIYTAFANPGQQDGRGLSPLAQIEQEAQDIRALLHPLDAEQRIKYLASAGTDLQALINQLRSQLDYLALFHFGGHASEDFLQFEDRQVTQQSLAQLLGNAPNLQLVFLNGCSTAGRVETLLQAGVPLVIGTDAAVNDALARKFATAFYHHLARSLSIKKAYLRAEGEARLWQNQYAPTRELHYSLPEEAAPAPHALEWGYHYQRSNRRAKKALQWRIMPVSKLVNPMELLKEQMARFKPEIQAEVERSLLQEGGGGSESTAQRLERLLPRVIIRNFPWPIGAHIQAIHASERPLDKLKQCCSLYVVAMKVQVFMLYSQLWQMNIRNADLPEAIRWETIGSSAASFPLLDWGALLKGLLAHYRQQSIAPFLREIDTLEESEDFWAICQRMEERIQELIAAHWELDLPTTEALLAEAEQDAQLFLMNIAFFARYELKSIKMIRVRKPRHDIPLFKHIIYNLNTTNLRGAVDVGEEEMDFFDSESVYLFAEDDAALPEVFRHKQQQVAALNLTPFIIDKNAYTESRRIPDIFSCVFEENDQYVYLRSDKDLFATLDTYRSAPDQHAALDHLTTLDEQYYPLNEQWEDWLDT